MELEPYYIHDVGKLSIIPDAVGPNYLTFMSNNTTWAQVDGEGKIVLLDLEKVKQVTKEDYMTYIIAQLVLLAYEKGKEDGRLQMLNQS